MQGLHLGGLCGGPCRALYGFVSTIMGKLRYLNKAVALVLGFVGVISFASHAPSRPSSSHSVRRHLLASVLARYDFKAGH